MINRALSCLLLQFILMAGFAQQNIDTILKQVEGNNKAIATNRKYWESKRLEFKTGITPYDPQIEYDYLLGSPAGAGNQKDFTVTQRIDFPTSYKRKKDLSQHQGQQGYIQEQIFRQDILLQTKLLLLDIVYLNKRDAELTRRLTRTETLLRDYEKKLDQGEVIILDVNKTRLQLLQIRNDVALNRNERSIALQALTELNGGFRIEVPDTVYAALPTIPVFETLDSTIEANDPLIKLYELDTEVQKRQIALQRAMNLPKIEAGYHAQGILGQNYRGFHAGISVPLWENKNRLKAAEVHLEHSAANAERHRLEHRMENMRLYEQLEVRKNAMLEYSILVDSLNNNALLDKALRLGQITIIQYFNDISFYFSAYDKYLEGESQYHQAVARLYKYKL